MVGKAKSAPVRLLPEEVANKIAAGEVVERPSSVVKELVENALDARATRISVRLVGAGRRLIEVVDNGQGMSEQDALLAIERHATSKIRSADDLDSISSFGFRGEALPSIAAVSRFEMLTRREGEDAATHIQIDGGILRDVSQAPGPVGTRISVNRLYFNTPVRAKFLKGVTTELSHCIDVVQRHALANPGVAFRFEHNEKILLEVPEKASLRERVALIWGLGFAEEMTELKGEQAGVRITGLIGSPSLNRSNRAHQFFFMNRRPVVNRSLQYGFQDGYQGLLTVGRHPVGVVLLTTHPRNVDVNVHPTKREVRFRDERAVRDAVRNIVRATLESIRVSNEDVPVGSTPIATGTSAAYASPGNGAPDPDIPAFVTPPPSTSMPRDEVQALQTEFTIPGQEGVAPQAVYRPVEELNTVALQLFDTYLLIPEKERLLIIDQHALHERLNYDILMSELAEHDYAAQRLAVPILIDVTPAQAKLLEANSELFSQIGIEIEPFGGNTFQVVSVCHLYDDGCISDAVYRVLDELGQGNLFDKENFVADLLRLTLVACKASVRAGDRLSDEEKRALVDGFRGMRPPYTCPHGRPIITELTQVQMEKSFRRRQ